MIHLEVAVCAPVKQTFTYSVDNTETANLTATDFTGRRVLIPFGRRPATGYVLGHSSADISGFDIKPIQRSIDLYPLFHASMVPFFRWVADYYHYPVGLVIKAALPAGLATKPKRKVVLTCSPAELAAHDIAEDITRKSWFKKLLSDGELSESAFKTLSANKDDGNVLALLIERGDLTIREELDQDRVRAKQEICYRLAPRLIRFYEQFEGAGKAVEKDLAAFVGRQLTKAETRSLDLLWELQATAVPVPRKELAARYAYGEKLLKRLSDEGLAERCKKRVFRSPYGDLLPHYRRPRKLSNEQKAVLKPIEEALEHQEYKPFLVHGVTGSGKTEVYLRAAERVIAGTRSVLVLVPEIALATQVEAHFVSRFGELVALLHSGLSQGERFDEWWRIQSGRARVVIGARSAVFAPLQEIGLIIVDEEHDTSYKQEDGLRYNGRDLALVRGKLAGSVVILGSATPAITSHYHSTTSKYHRLEMRRRIGDRSLPQPLVVDLKESIDRKGSKLFHPQLQDEMVRTFENSNQSILLLNRRGFSTSVICRNCGTVVECSHCRVSLNHHRQRNLLLCHYCGFNLSDKRNCSVCGSENLQPIGFGTERIEEEAAQLLPEARIARLDSDVASDRKRFLAILQAMARREIDVLVGTQIVAKGLHFPHVTLVGIVMADSGLGFPDFRAAEKTFQLITQVTGRAGRGDTEGTVIIQTMQPEHYAITMAAGNQYTDMVQRELSIRESVGFPPYCRLVFIIIEHPDDVGARKAGAEIGALLRSWCKRNDVEKSLTVLGPAPAPLERLKDRYRWQILIKSRQLTRLHEMIEWLSSNYKTRGLARLIIDIDPENML
jgi:primosomal protein N' (replication factor Y)